MMLLTAMTIPNALIILWISGQANPSQRAPITASAYHKRSRSRSRSRRSHGGCPMSTIVRLIFVGVRFRRLDAGLPTAIVSFTNLNTGRFSPTPFALSLLSVSPVSSSQSPSSDVIPMIESTVSSSKKLHGNLLEISSSITENPARTSIADGSRMMFPSKSHEARERVGDNRKNKQLVYGGADREHSESGTNGLVVDFKLDENFDWNDYNYKFGQYQNRKSLAHLSRITGTTNARRRRDDRDRRKEAIDNFKKNFGIKKIRGLKGKVENLMVADANQDVVAFDMDMARPIDSNQPVDSPLKSVSIHNSVTKSDVDSGLSSLRRRTSIRAGGVIRSEMKESDCDEKRGVGTSPQRRKIIKLMNSWAFEVFTWTLILFNVVVNTLLVTFNSRCAADGDNQSYEQSIGVLRILCYVYIFVYTIEMMVRLSVGGFSFWKDNYNVQDLVVLFAVLVPFTIEAITNGISSNKAEAWLSLSVIRLLRVLRIVDWVRFKPIFHELFILVRGLASSMRVLVWGVLLGLLILYVFAVVLATVVGNGSIFQHQLYDGWFLDLYGVDISVYARELFGTIPTCMLSLFRIMTLDNWSEMVDPITSTSTFLTYFFILFIIFTVFAFLNLVTAVIVESSTQLQKEEDNRLERLFMRKMKELERMIELAIGKRQKIRPGEMIDLYMENTSVQKVMKVFGIVDVEDITGLLSIICDQRAPKDKIRIKDILLAMTRYSNQNAKSRDILELLAIARRTNHEIYWGSKRLTKMHREMKYVLSTHLKNTNKNSNVQHSQSASFFLDKPTTMMRKPSLRSMNKSQGNIFPVDSRHSQRSQSESRSQAGSTIKVNSSAQMRRRASQFMRNSVERNK
eukprot:GHVH01016083.1.p1 GENE.GHVH01016083.1~~GHVH01016083.1.p1  ORF type:complete len:853 (+),score=94.34 GHVH01016083.1:2072-4630(+)